MKRAALALVLAAVMAFAAFMVSDAAPGDLIRSNNQGGQATRVPAIPGTPCWRIGSQTYRPDGVPFSACSTSTTSTTTVVVSSTSTTLAPTTTVAPSTSTSVPSPTQPPSSTSSPSTTTPAGGYNPADYLIGAPASQDMSWEPSGNFRTGCSAGATGQFDPIVYPGQAGAGHLHQFFGNTAINPNSDYASLRGSGSSTCDGGPLNRTGYWAPAMLNGAGQVVTPNFIILYYKAEGGGWTLAEKQAQIRATQPFPAGLKMVAGYNMTTGASDHFYFACEDNPGAHLGQIPLSCGGHILGVVEFPQCWDGANLDSADHRSHMSYKFYDNGKYICPTSHPVPVPSITELIYYPGGNYSGWSVSSDAMAGTTRGASFHADWFGAWDPAIMDRWLNACIRGMRNGISSNLCDGQALKPAT